MSTSSSFPREPASQHQLAPNALQSRRATTPKLRSNGGDAQSATLGPKQILHACVKWWMVALPLGLACATVAAAVTWIIFTHQYRASVWIQIFEAPQYLLFGERDNPRSQLFVATQIQLITSPMVMYGMDDIGPQGVVDELLQKRLDEWQSPDVPDLSGEEQRDRTFLARWIADRVSVQRVGKTSELYTVSFSSQSPKFAQAIANAVARNYLALLADHSKKRNVTMVELLEEANKNRGKLLDSDRAELVKLAELLPHGGGILGKSGPETAPYSALAGVQARLSSAEVDLELAKAHQQLLAKPPAPDAGQAPPPADAFLAAASEATSDPNVAKRLEEIARLKATLDEIERVSRQGKDDPRCQPLQDTIRTMEEQLRKAVESRMALSKQQRLALAQRDAENKRLEVAMLKKRYDDLLSEARRGNSKLLELDLKRLDVQREQDVIERIAARVQALQLEQSAPEQVELWRAADEPTTPEQRYPTRQLALAIPGGLALPFLLFVLWEFLARRVLDSDRLERDLALTVFGEIARLPRHRPRGLPKPTEQLAGSLQLFRESIDTLSTNLAMTLDLHDVKTFAIASAVSGEGKTSVAAELARHLSETCGAKVLLIDADMRSPDIHRLFRIPREPGLSALLAHQATPQQAIVTTWSERLHLLPAGRLTSSPAALLGNGNLKTVLEQVLPEYRFVVIDTPPVLSTSESLILSNVADVTLLCVMWDVSRGDQVRRACKRLSMSGTNDVGLVMNGVPNQHYRHRYGKYPYPAQATA